METAGLKFKCKTQDLVNAIKKYCGIENVVIENSEEIEGAVNSLLGSKNLTFISVVPEKCRIDGDNVIIGVESLSSTYTVPGSTIVHERGGGGIDFLKKFFEESKILQEMIEGKEEKDE